MKKKILGKLKTIEEITGVKQDLWDCLFEISKKEEFIELIEVPPYTGADYRDLDGNHYKKERLKDIKEVEGKVDWSGIKEGTRVLVNGDKRRYFHHYSIGCNGVFCYSDGGDRWTSEGTIVGWRPEDVALWED
ncbi:MAG TPA: hypothetical protein ENG87_03845 [Candidatus Pacearchaeota archaeon]|nr:hypothetical protein [Candidatus Pacearchaeota archaeon]